MVLSFCSLFVLAQVEISIARILFKAIEIEHMRLSGTHITFRAVNSRPMYMYVYAFDTLFASLFTLDTVH